MTFSDPFCWLGKGFYNESLRGGFGDALLEMDHSIGRIISALRRSKVYEDTVIFFLSDNG